MASGTPTDESNLQPRSEAFLSQSIGEGPRVLVVDDNEPTARALSALLATARLKSAVFYRGHEALEYAGQNPCLAAIVDIHLPDINGILLAQQLRGRFGPNTPIVVISGDTSMPTLSAVSEIGATHFFSKPVNAGHLLERLREWIADAPRGGSRGE